ncbi:MAG: polymer-forming cytoskeletal protein [Clostridia bacterium]|nr:polymer-forming cytoskeletal protein [Clostridia bacterium]
MATKDNFVKALKELTGFDEEGAAAGTQAAPQEKAEETPSFEEKLQEAVEESVEEPAEEPVAVQESEVAPEQPQPAHEELVHTDAPKPVNANIADIFAEKTVVESAQGSGETTRITANMVVIGDITSTDRVDIFGRVRGDIQTEDDIVLEGVVEGGISGRNMLLQGSALRGNVLASGDVAIESGSVIVGNVQAENVKLDGKVKGNLFVEQMTQLTENALLVGDVETTGVAASVGSRIRGNIKTKQANDISEDEEFILEV